MGRYKAESGANACLCPSSSGLCFACPFSIDGSCRSPVGGLGVFCQMHLTLRAASLILFRRRLQPCITHLQNGANCNVLCQNKPPGNPIARLWESHSSLQFFVAALCLLPYIIITHITLAPTPVHLTTTTHKWSIFILAPSPRQSALAAALWHDGRCQQI